MDSLTDLLAAEIASGGPLRFSRFMEAALYHPEFGYYRRPRDPFGAQGDFFTASQLQPVFGRLLAQAFMALRDEMGSPAEFRVLEVGAGRGDLREHLASLQYQGVDVDTGDWPASIHGVVFSNELFDALPVDVAVWEGGRWRQSRVDWDGTAFGWRTAEPLTGDELAYVEANALPSTERLEIPIAGLRMLDRMIATLRKGWLVFIDYGYTRRELLRFPQGTLMSYRRHRALDDCLAHPGQQDITAHAAFDPLLERAQSAGMRLERFETLQRFLLGVGETDQFASALAAASEKESLAHRLQLKTLLFSLGETFRVAVLRR